MPYRRYTTKLVGLFAAGLLAFNFPVVGLLDTRASVGGIPLAYLLLFLSWGVFIILLIRIVSRHPGNKGTRHE